MELRCSRALALLLGAISPTDVAHHKELKAAGHMLVRDESGNALFWPWISNGAVGVMIAKKRSI